jgi:hypothetical protein
VNIRSGTNIHIKQRKLSCTTDSKAEPADEDEASVPLVQMDEPEANGTQPLSPFDGGSISSSIGLLKSTSTIATASNLLCHNLLKAVHLSVSVILYFAVAICIIAFLVHAVMPEELSLPLNVCSQFFPTLAMCLINAFGAVMCLGNETFEISIDATATCEGSGLIYRLAMRRRGGVNSGTVGLRDM